MHEAEDGASSHSQSQPSPLSYASLSSSSYGSASVTAGSSSSSSDHAESLNQHNVTVRGIIPALHLVRDSQSDLLQIGSLISRFATDPEPTIRAELGEQLPSIACFCLNANNNSNSNSGSSSSSSSTSSGSSSGPVGVGTALLLVHGSGGGGEDGTGSTNNNINNNNNGSRNGGGGKWVHDAVYNTLLEVLEQLLTDENTRVRHITQTSLIFMLEKRLLDTSFVEEKISPVLVHLMDVTKIDDYRTEAVTVSPSFSCSPSFPAVALLTQCL